MQPFVQELMWKNRYNTASSKSGLPNEFWLCFSEFQWKLAWYQYMCTTILFTMECIHPRGKLKFPSHQNYHIHAPITQSQNLYNKLTSFDILLMQEINKCDNGDPCSSSLTTAKVEWNILVFNSGSYECMANNNNGNASHHVDVPVTESLPDESV